MFFFVGHPKTCLSDFVETSEIGIETCKSGFIFRFVSRPTLYRFLNRIRDVVIAQSSFAHVFFLIFVGNQKPVFYKPWELIQESNGSDVTKSKPVVWWCIQVILWYSSESEFQRSGLSNHRFALYLLQKTIFRSSRLYWFSGSKLTVFRTHWERFYNFDESFSMIF